MGNYLQAAAILQGLQACPRGWHTGPSSPAQADVQDTAAAGGWIRHNYHDKRDKQPAFNNSP